VEDGGRRVRGVEDVQKEEERLESFDEQPQQERNSEAIDFPVASGFFVPTKQLKPSDLRTLKVLVPSQVRQVASVGGDAPRFPFDGIHFQPDGLAAP
jgi:hypothetical protein